MAGGSGRIVTGGSMVGSKARVENERLWVDALISGGSISGNVTIVAPLPLPVDVVSIVEPFEVLPLSFSTDGQPIVVNGGGFVNLHTVAANSRDVVTIFVTNVDTADRTFILGWGGTATGQQMFIFAPAKETVVAASELVLNAGQTIQANLDLTGTCRVVGRVTRRAV